MGLGTLKRQLPVVFEHRNFFWIAAALAVLLCSGSLRLGWYADDYVHRAMLLRSDELPDLARSPWDIFAFIRGDAEKNQQFKNRGLLPWWSSPHLRLAFFRPLSSLTHWMDYRLWPESSFLMHVHSLLWFGLAVAAAALLFRRFEPPAVAGLAALLFALDDAHAVPAMWVANRNASVAALFGILGLIFYDRWRRNDWRAGGVLAPASFFLALLGGELGLAAGGYLIAYVLFVERGPLWSRLRPAFPALLLFGGWLAVYRQMGYGASGSAMYIDPVADPVRYLEAALIRGPILLWGQFGLSSDLFLLLSERWSRILWFLIVVLLVLLAVLLVRHLRHSRTARFWACGMLLSLLPCCSTFPADRLLFFSGIGGAALVAAFLREALGRPPAAARRRITPVFVSGGVLLALHLFLAPLGLLAAPGNMAFFRDVLRRSAESYPGESTVARQHVLIVTTPSAFISLYVPLMQADDAPVPIDSLVLGSGIYGTQVSRPNIRTLVLQPQGGFLLPPGRSPEKSLSPPFDWRYAYGVFALLFTDDPRAQPGDRIDLAPFTVEILQVTEEGRPLKVAFHFRRELEDPSFRWIRWQNGIYVPFELPRVGQSLHLPPNRLEPE